VSWKLPPAVWVIVGLLTLSFALCIFVPLLAWADIPDLFSDSVKSAFDTFATPLGGAIGFIFSVKFRSKAPGAKSESARSAYTSVEIFAILLVVLYCGFFDVLILLFSVHRMNMAAVIAVTSQLRPYVAFLITAVIAYYFGAHKAASE
jgi:hypothetical protein